MNTNPISTYNRLMLCQCAVCGWRPAPKIRTGGSWDNPNDSIPDWDSLTLTAVGFKCDGCINEQIERDHIDSRATT